MTQEKFRISNSYFIPEESGIIHVQSERFVRQEDFTNLKYSTWQPGDELFVPIKGSAKMYEGWLSVDTPINRKRPTLDVITLLEETVDIVTQKVREIRAHHILKEKHKALSESEEKYRNLIDSNPDPILIYQNNRIILVNPAFTQLLGYNQEDHSGESSFLKMIEEKYHGGVLKRIKARLAGKPHSQIYRIDMISKEGEIIPCETASSLIQHQGQPSYMVTFRDIRDRIKVMDDLKNSEEFNQAIIKHSPMGVSVRSNTGKLLSANDAWIKIWGHTEEEMIDFTTRERAELKFDYCDEYLGRWISTLERVYKEGGYLHVPDVKVSNPKGREGLWVSQHFYAIKNASGEVDRVVILTEDITERKIAEDKIRAINMDKLEQAKRIAGTFAHEIRNALFPASASLNRLKLLSGSSSNSEDLKKYSSIAEQSITRAADITGLISSYTKLDTERMPERVNLNEIFQELFKNNELRLRENNVEVNILGESYCLVRSNRRQLLLAFNNLLLNSIDAIAEKNERKDGRINIGMSANDGACGISFQDNGCGIPPDYLDRIFEPFFSKKSQNGGTGLGLAMAKRIIEMYGGTVLVKSEPKNGTTFNINLQNYENDNVDKTKSLE